VTPFGRRPSSFVETRTRKGKNRRGRREEGRRMGREERRKGLQVPKQNSNRTKLKKLGLMYSDRCSELPTLKFKVGTYFLRWNRVDLQKNAGRTSDEKEQREESV